MACDREEKYEELVSEFANHVRAVHLDLISFAADQ